MSEEERIERIERERIKHIKQQLYEDVWKHYHIKNCYGCVHWVPCEDIETCDIRRNLSCFDNLEEIAAHCKNYKEKK